MAIIWLLWLFFTNFIYLNFGTVTVNIISKTETILELLQVFKNSILNYEFNVFKIGLL